MKKDKVKMVRFLLPSVQKDSEQVKFISDKYDISPVAAKILINRGIKDLDEYFSMGTINDPMDMQDMERAVLCIKTHIENGNDITIFGDYDADGVCASSLLYMYLQDIGANVQVYLPSRETDGYGLNMAAIDTISNQGTKLIITVDCGISNYEEVAYAKTIGMDVIVSDHHQCPDILPECEAILNPLLGKYPYKLLCGTGVALKIVQALGGNEAFNRYVDLAAIATVADLVPLTGENRAIVKRGLEAINGEYNRTSIRALVDKCGYGDGALTSGQIAFGIGPRLNAAGRMDSAKKAFDLLVERDYSKASKQASLLNDFNNKRRAEESSILEEAEKAIAKMTKIESQKIMVVWGKDWSKGVIGIVASKLVEKYHRPVIVFSLEKDVLVGSGRSVPGVHLFNLINNFSSLLIKFGGHEMAAGMSIKESKLKTFIAEINKYADDNYPQDLFIPTVQCDADLEPSEVTLKLVYDIEKLAPMGMANKTPVFRVQDVNLVGSRLIGSDLSHVKMSLVREEIAVDAVAFSMGHRACEINDEYHYDIAVNVSGNFWNGSNHVQCQVKNFKPNLLSTGSKMVTSAGKDYFDSLYAASIIEPIFPKLTRVRYRYNWEEYLNKRLRKDVLGTAIYTSIPTCSYELISFLSRNGLGENVEVYKGAPKVNSCVVVAPNWNIDVLNYSRLIIFDYAPVEFVNRVLEKNPNIEVIICNGDSIKNNIYKFILGLDFERDRAKVYYSIIKEICKSNLGEEELVKQFCFFGKETPFNAYFALRVFNDLGFVYTKDGTIYTNKTPQHKDLHSSPIVKNITNLRKRMEQEIEYIISQKTKG